MQTPENNAELAQIHFLLEKSSDFSAPLRGAARKLKNGGDTTEASCLLRSHITTMRHLADRLDAVAAADADIAAA